MMRLRFPYIWLLAFTTLSLGSLGPWGTSRLQATAGPLDRQTTLWGPFVEWSLDNPSNSGNPFDLVATVTFTHTQGETRTTEMFYDGGTTWKFRFTATREGSWDFVSSSPDPELDGHTGTVTVDAPEAGAFGFVSTNGEKWLLEGRGAFVPQFLMWRAPDDYSNNPALIDGAIQEFMVEHGFTGFHTRVYCQWFGLGKPRSDDYDQDENDPDPDPVTFSALELLISKVHEAGGVVHIWAWGDEQRKQTPVRWGLNGAVDQRLQRYIAARLGPVPGWTMGYGFDLDEWVLEGELHAWNDFMQVHLGWHHFLGGRPEGPNSGTDHSAWNSWNESMEYSSYEHHKPSYDVYVAALQAVPGQPVLSEDRFRIRPWKNPIDPKDYNEEETRRGLWHSTMAGGVANIWGDLTDDQTEAAISRPYPNKGELKTYFVFWEDRFIATLVRDNALTDGVALRSGSTSYIFYKEDTDSIWMDLTGMSGTLPAIAIDTTQSPYQEVVLGVLTPSQQTESLPYVSDWAIAVGDSAGAGIFADGFESGNTSAWSNSLP